MRGALATALLGVALVGCRAILGIEDAPAETGGAGGDPSTASTTSLASIGSTSSDASSSGGTTSDGGASTGDGGAVPTATVNGTGASQGGAGGEGGGGVEPEPTVFPFPEGQLGRRIVLDKNQDDDTVDLTDEVVLVSRDEGQLLTYFWRLNLDLTNPLCCSELIAPSDDDDFPERVASSLGRVFYTPDQADTFWPTPLTPLCMAESPCDCKSNRGELGISGIDVRDGVFYAVEQSGGSFGTLAYHGTKLDDVQEPPGGVQSGGPMAIRGTHATAGQHIGGGGTVSIFDVTGEDAPTNDLNAPNGEYIAVAAAADGYSYAWLRYPEGDVVIDSDSAQLVAPTNHDAVPGSLAVDVNFIYVPNDPGVIVCARDGSGCHLLAAGGGLVEDVAVRDDALYVVQGTRVLRYDTLTFGQFNALPPWVPAPTP